MSSAYHIYDLASSNFANRDIFRVAIPLSDKDSLFKVSRGKSIVINRKWIALPLCRYVGDLIETKKINGVDCNVYETGPVVWDEYAGMLAECSAEIY